jgi:hypothetical protein
MFSVNEVFRRSCCARGMRPDGRLDAGPVGAPFCDNKKAGICDDFRNGVGGWTLSTTGSFALSDETADGPKGSLRAADARGGSTAVLKALPAALSTAEFSFRVPPALRNAVIANIYFEGPEPACFIKIAFSDGLIELDDGSTLGGGEEYASDIWQRVTVTRSGSEVQLVFRGRTVDTQNAMGCGAIKSFTLTAIGTSSNAIEFDNVWIY